MRYFPAFHDLSARPTLVVGGGELAARKLRLLLKAGARAVVVAPAGCAEIADLARSGAITWHSRTFKAQDVAGSALVIGATGRRRVDEAVSAAAQAAGLPVHVVGVGEGAEDFRPFTARDFARALVGLDQNK